MCSRHRQRHRNFTHDTMYRRRQQQQSWLPFSICSPFDLIPHYFNHFLYVRTFAHFVSVGYYLSFSILLFVIVCVCDVCLNVVPTHNRIPNTLHIRLLRQACYRYLYAGAPVVGSFKWMLLFIFWVGHRLVFNPSDWVSMDYLQLTYIYFGWAPGVLCFIGVRKLNTL